MSPAKSYVRAELLQSEAGSGMPNNGIATADCEELLRCQSNPLKQPGSLVLNF